MLDKRFQVEYNTKYPLSNDPDDERKDKRRVRYIVNGLLQCRKCMQWKKWDQEFHKAPGLPYGVAMLCKECAYNKIKEYRKRKKEEKLAQGITEKKPLPKHTLRQRHKRKNKSLPDITENTSEDNE